MRPELGRVLVVGLTLVALGCEPLPVERAQQNSGVGSAADSDSSSEVSEVADTASSEDADSLEPDVPMVEPPPAGGIAVWRFDDQKGYYARAAGCPECTAELHNFPLHGAGWRNPLKGSGWATDASALDGKILMLDGENDYLDLPLVADLFSREAWSYQARIRLCGEPSPSGASSDGQTEEAFVDNGLGRNQALFSTYVSLGLAALVGTDGLLTVHGYACEEDSLDNYVVGGDGSCPGGQCVVRPGDWVWLTVTFGPNTGMSLFVDETLVRQCSSASYLDLIDGGRLTFGAAYAGTSFPMVASQTVFNDSGSVASQVSETLDHFCGDLDEVRVWDRALSALEVQELVADGQVDAESDLESSTCKATNGCKGSGGEPVGTDSGVVACPVEGAKEVWNEVYDAIEDACGPGWHVCRMGELQARTPNRPLSVLSEGTWYLAQTGCGGAVATVYKDLGYSANGSDPCSTCDTIAKTDAPPGAENGLVVSSKSSDGHDCSTRVSACGLRLCRPARLEEQPKGFLCCADGCYSTLPSE